MADRAVEVGSSISFENVICGVDSSAESREATSQAVVVADEGARLWAVSVWDPGLAMHAGIHASEVAADLRNASSTALAEARRAVPGIESLLIRGGQVAGMLAAIANLEADLVSVGAHGLSRPAGVLFGSVATAMAHHAPCSVLIARRPEAGTFPAPIIQATDGSVEALAASSVAGRIAARQGAAVTTLNVGDDPERGAEIAAGAAASIRGQGSESTPRAETGSPPAQIIEVANEIGASLIVIGSRGMTGVRALGSVSERVAHRAPCSVLIVRPTSHPSTDSGPPGGA